MTERLTSAQYTAASKAPKKGRFPRVSKERRTWNGIVFDSEREMLRYIDRTRAEEAGLIFDLKRQTSYSVEINGQHYCKYKPDVEYRTAEGRLVYEDVKSTGTRQEQAYRLRKKAFELYYGVEVTEIVK